MKSLWPTTTDKRQWMIETICDEARLTMRYTGRDTLSERVLAVMSEIPRHRFVPQSMRAAAYDNAALPVGHGQTISQPFIVALMTDLLDLRGDERVLEIGTGTGYQTAILARLGGEVFSIEYFPELSARARKHL
ncbi:MAG: protein-L-isoaspartate O-methyltransferase, partial [Mariprofundaceae bacterium]